MGPQMIKTVADPGGNLVAQVSNLCSGGTGFQPVPAAQPPTDQLFAIISSASGPDRPPPHNRYAP
ncbi:MAG: hypothetical protein KDA05_09540, partial [Phycisphaerales bacterium]|nr:hypothetical protein [Phycisphaerales bacterium]